MNRMVTAIYENGVLRPLAPLMLPERSRVRVQMDEALVAAGLSLSEPFCPPLSPARFRPSDAKSWRGCLPLGGRSPN